MNDLEKNAAKRLEKLASDAKARLKEKRLKKELRLASKREPGGSAKMRPLHPRTALIEAELVKTRSGREAAMHLRKAKDLKKAGPPVARGILNAMTLGLGTPWLTVTGREVQAKRHRRKGIAAGSDAKSLRKITAGMGNYKKLDGAAKKLAPKASMKSRLAGMLRKLITRGK